MDSQDLRSFDALLRPSGPVYHSCKLRKDVLQDSYSLEANLIPADSTFVWSEEALQGQFSFVVNHTPCSEFMRHMERPRNFCSELRSGVNVEVGVLGSPSLIVILVSVDVKQHFTELNVCSFDTSLTPTWWTSVWRAKRLQDVCTDRASSAIFVSTGQTLHHSSFGHQWQQAQEIRVDSENWCRVKTNPASLCTSFHSSQRHRSVSIVHASFSSDCPRYELHQPSTLIYPEHSCQHSLKSGTKQTISFSLTGEVSRKQCICSNTSSYLQI